MIRPLWLVSIYVLLAGCGAQSLKVGSDGEATGGAVGTGGTGAGGTSSPVSSCTDAAAVSSPLPVWPTADGCVIGTGIAQFAGTWEGYYQGSSVSDEASTFRLQLGANAAQAQCGTITFGVHHAPTTLAPATSASEWYPSPDVYPIRISTTPNFTSILGLAYTLLEIKSDGQRVDVSYSLTEMLKSWCALQPSYPAGTAGQYNCCLGTCAAMTIDSTTCTVTKCPSGSDRPVPCNVLMYCSFAGCVCNECGCAAAPTVAGNTFHLTFDGDNVTGTDDAARTIIMQRISAADAGS